MEISLEDLYRYRELEPKLGDQKIVDYIMEVIEVELINNNISPSQTIAIEFIENRNKTRYGRFISPRYYNK